MRVVLAERVAGRGRAVDDSVGRWVSLLLRLRRREGCRQPRASLPMSWICNAGERDVHDEHVGQIVRVT